MAKIGIGTPIRRWKGNFMECKCTIHPTRTMNGTNKRKGIDNPTKIAGPREKGTVKTQL